MEISTKFQESPISKWVSVTRVGKNCWMKACRPKTCKSKLTRCAGKRGKGHGKGHGGGGGGIFGQGVGRLMPQEVRAMGQQMHVAAGEVSLAAQKAGDSPTVKDYQAVLSNIQEMTAMCSACHSSFKIR